MIAISPHCDTSDSIVKPINLREKYGHRYRVEREESFNAQYGPRAHKEDPWLMIIPGRYGHIYPFGGSQLAASTNTRGRVANRLLAMDCCQTLHNGDDGVTVVFDVADFRKIASEIKARTTRKLSPDQCEKFVAAGAEFRRNRQKAAALSKAS